MSITGMNASQPIMSGLPIGDLGGGMFGVIGILSAIIERQSTNKGQHIDISLLDVQISLLNYMATMHTLSGENPEPIGNAHFVHVPYNTFITKDGFIVIAVITDEFWSSLLKVLKIEKLKNPTFANQQGRLKNQKLIEELINARLATQNSSFWLNRLNEVRVPCAPVNNFSKALSDEQVLQRNMVVEVDHPSGGKIKMPGNPVKLSNSTDKYFSPPPMLGEHTEEILHELIGYNQTKIKNLRKKKIVG